MTNNHKKTKDFSIVAWHVGRHGEVAGGMTQVVNGYLEWSFDDLNVRVLATRDGSRWLHAIKVFFSALYSFFKIKNANSNVFIVHLSQGGSFIREGIFLLLARARGFGTVAHIHGSRFVEFANRFPFLVKFVLRAASKVIVLSDATFTKISELIPDSRIELVPNAVPAGKSTPKEKLIVFGGGVSFRKGVDVLVKAWSAIENKNGWRLEIAGPIIDAKTVPDEIGNGEFLGAVSHDVLMRMLERSSVAVLPSRDEAMPMFILEAMARDNCVISTRVGGIPNLLANDRGVLVDAGDIDQLTSAIIKVINDDVYRNRVTVLGRLTFNESFSADTVYPYLEKLWLEAIPNY